MVSPDEFRKRIEASLSQDYKVEFLGKKLFLGEIIERHQYIERVKVVTS